MTTETKAPPTTVTFRVTGMTCASCVRRIEKALGKVDGVAEANVNLATETARVAYDPTVATPDQLKAAVEKAGYSVRDFPVQAAQAAPAATTPGVGDVTLPIEGMTCASCVRRIEKALSKVEGVQQADVNLATEKARVVFDPAVASLEQMRAAVEKAGYTVGQLATASAPAVDNVPPAEDAHDRERQREIDDLRRKWTLSLAAGLLMMALTYVPLNVPMDVIAPVLLIVTTIVQFWAGAPIYRAAWAAARHGGTNMNTLIAVGTSVAYGYSAFVTLWPRLSAAWGFPQHLYFETAVIIVALILLGRWLEARAKKQTSVVTNALRLRRLRRPKSADAILHPSLRERVSEYAYLVAIALVALAVGIAALAFARSEMGASSATIGAASASVSRTTQVDTTDTLRFTPDALAVRTGETIAFEIRNSGALPHEFFIGTPAEQQSHEREMASEMSMDDEPGQVEVPASRTVRLVYTFDQPGTLEYGCHVPGHYAAAMRGTITIF